MSIKNIALQILAVNVVSLALPTLGRFITVFSIKEVLLDRTIILFPKEEKDGDIRVLDKNIL